VVIFANAGRLHTTADFSTAGTYVLRLTASDGVSSANDDLTVMVNGQLQLPLRMDSVDWSGGPSPVAHLHFSAVAGQTYTVQYRDSLSGDGWLRLANVPSQPMTQTVEVTDLTATNTPTRYYRMATP
jgi:hypothetical protein